MLSKYRLPACNLHSKGDEKLQFDLEWPYGQSFKISYVDYTYILCMLYVLLLLTL